MSGMLSRKLRVCGVVLVAAAIAAAAHQVIRAQAPENSEAMLTYSRGQAVLPVYEGWHPNPDGTIDLWFGYLNQNYREEPDLAIGPENDVSAPYGPDGGQPTHFLPRNNRWVFAVRVPKDFGDKEVVWTLTSKGKTFRAYATLKPAYLHDDVGLSREFFGDAPAGGNQPPSISLDGADRRTVKVGEAATLAITATDDGVPRAANRNAQQGANRNNRPRTSICGENTNIFFCGEPNEGAGNLFSVKGFRMACFPYRGDARNIAFDPPQEKVWEDHRGGSPWASGYALPPIPKDNKWIIHTSFKQPGTYVVRCQAHDGLLVTNQNVTFTVQP